MHEKRGGGVRGGGTDGFMRERGEIFGDGWREREEILEMRKGMFA